MTFDTLAPRRPWGGMYGVLALLLAEVVLTAPIYQLLVTFDCWANWPRALCTGFNMAMIGVYIALAGLGLLAMLLAPERRALLQDAGLRTRPLLVNLAGVAVFFVPVLLFQEGAGTRNMAPILACWALGLGLAGAGALGMLAPSARWAALLRARWGMLLACLVAGLVAPYLAQTILPLWRVGLFSDATFHSVLWLMSSLGSDVTANFAERSIGDDTFRANIAPLCSGVEGMALILFFVSMYLVLFRKELRFPAVLLLYPFGLVASWLLNVVRISLLITIGVNGHPELAVNGFHSHAGWLMFTVLSLVIVGIARFTGYFAAEAQAQRAPLMPFLADPVVAQILPFAVFMASALLANTFANAPALVYPLRALAMAAVLALVLPHLRALPWRLDPLSLAAGLAIGVIWAATSPPATASDQALSGVLAALPQGEFTLWVLARVLGTVVLVPVIEELFFRAYLLTRLGGQPAPIWRLVLAVAVTSALFGALHDRWALAAVAGAVYALLRLRSGRVTDAILSHATSNAWIAGAAILANDWSLI